MKQVGDIHFPSVETQLLEYWEKHSVFATQNQNMQDAKEFSFYDGPPFANGLPHYGHLLASTIKDTVARYWIMKGARVNRRFGWDCHGLPVEFEIEKREKLKGRQDIIKMGVDRFNEICRRSVLEYTAEWQKTITRLGRWVDWDDQYHTMDKNFMESVWWVFSELHRKGLIYKGFKVVPYSPRTTSVVSNFEANQNYKMVDDPSIFVKFPLKEAKCFLIVWTTTPWTLPANLAIAVNSSVEYVELSPSDVDERWILATSALPRLFGKTKDAYTTIKRFKGCELVGRIYEPLFPYFSEHKNAFRILHGDFVDTENGSGIVHQAPAYGENDFFACKEHDIELVDVLDSSGHFTKDAPDFEGLEFKEADKLICRNLKERGLLVKQGTIKHSYPFDERTDTPLIYKAVPSWYVSVEKLVDRLVANNKTIRWVPEHLRDGRMGTWLQNARDWSISRNRFWGTPLPVWVCTNNSEHIRVIGSVQELEQLTGRKFGDLHLHFVGDTKVPCDQCDGTAENENLVFDCWFESGSMPYAQHHYPFENKKHFTEIFPADFVAEGLDQTRGWFYTLNVLSCALFDRPAFKNVIVNGVILDSSGKKMSKRLRNYTPPIELMEKYGADSVRLSMLDSQLLRAEDLVFSDNDVREITRKVLLPLWNACSFLTTYTHADSWAPSQKLLEGVISKPADELDRWIISRLNTIVKHVDLHMSEYKLYLVVPQVLEFIDDLTNFYIRLSRKRFWGSNRTGISSGQTEAYSTLFFVLYQFSKVLAPFAPFIADKLYGVLVEPKGDQACSVHLCQMPAFDASLCETELEDKFDLVRQIVSQGRYLRQKHKIKTRQVLPSLTVITKSHKARSYIEASAHLLTSELNVKELKFFADERKHVRIKLRPNLPLLGAKLGPRLRELRSELEGLNRDADSLQALVDQLEANGTAPLQCGITVALDEVIIDREPLDNNLLATTGEVTLLLDTKLSPALVAEGRARELVNRIQNLRKNSGLDVSTRVHIEIIAAPKLADDITKHRDYICEETLGTKLHVISGSGQCNLKFVENYSIDGMSCVVSLEAE